MSITAAEAVRPFLEPKSVALVGVSRRTGPGSFNILEEMINYSYQGRIYPVNPKGGEILGVKTYTSITELPETPDIAVICTPRTAVPEIARQCASKNIKGIIIITQGFSDAEDKDGQELHQEILNAVKGTSTRIIGPNTLGVINNFNKFNTSFIEIHSQKREVGVICQSGIFMAASGDFTGGIGIGIDTGNTADLDVNDILEYMSEDQRIKVINMHIEGLKDGRRFLESTKKASKKKPVLALKTGTSEEGARAASSHSGSLAGEDRVYDAALRQSGAIRISNVNEMEDLTDTFLTFNSMPGKRIAVITISGGAGIIAVDAITNNGLEVASFNDDTIQTLKEIYPGWMQPGNPADIWPAGMSQGYQGVLHKSMETILSDPGVDAVLLITPAYLSPDNDPLDIRDIINEIAAKHSDKPVTAWLFGPYRREYAATLKEKGNIIAYPSAERAMYSLSRLYDWLRNSSQEETSYIEPKNINKEMVTGIIDSNLKSGTYTLNEQALDIFNSYGIPVVSSGIAMNAEEAVQKAGKLGYPVVMKVISPQITHKSDSGGVKLNIGSSEEVYRAWDEITASVSQIAGAKILGVLLQKHHTGGTEIILGAKRDPQFGPVLIFGLGGIYTELIQDTSLRIAPVSPEEARAMIQETRAYKILQGTRGQTASNIDSIVDNLVRLGVLMENHPEIVELDINPVTVDSTQAIALDGRIMLNSI